MEYTIRRGEPVSDEIKRIVEGIIEAGIEHIDGDMNRHETVHEIRKRCKEVRAAARLVRPVLPTYSEMNAHYRDAARRISDIRDAHAAIETFDDHVRPAADDDGRLSADTLDGVRETLVNRREEVSAEQDLDQRLANVRADLVEGREYVPYLPIATDGYDAVAGGLRKSYKRARNRMPVVILGRMAPTEDHRVDRTRSPHRLSSRPVQTPVVQFGLGFGVILPIIVALEEFRERCRNTHFVFFVRGPCFQQQHRRILARRKPIG